MTKVLAVLSVTPDYEQFGVPELKSILRRTGISLSILLKYQIEEFPEHQYDINYKNFKNYPFIVLNIPDFEKHREYLQKAANNGIMVTKFILLVAEGKSYQQMFETFNKQIVERQLSDWGTTLLCQFYSRNRTIGRKQQKTKIHELLERMKICGKIDLEKPMMITDIVEDHKWFHKHHQVPSQETLNRVFFGIELSSNRTLTSGAKFNQKYELSNRIYLGPTSTDNDLAFLMCHQGLIDQNSFVLDPFAGTGSLLIPPSHYGAYVFGSDLDIRVLNGYSVGQINKRSKYYEKQKQLQIYTPKIMLNFRQYELKQPQIFRMDCLKGRFRMKGMFDAIICDPPYGIRAMSRKINQKRKESQNYKEQNFHAQFLEKKQIKQQSKQQINQQKQQFEESSPLQKQQTMQKITQMQKQQPFSKDTQLDEKQQQKRSEKRKLRKQKRKQRKDQLTQTEKQYKQTIQDKFCEQLKTKWVNKPNIECVSKDQIYNGLLDFSNSYLKDGGYLVFLYPVLEQEQYQGTAEELPKHSNFELVDYSVHKLKEGNARILITMRKILKQ